MGRVIRAECGNASALHIEEAQMRECEAGVRRNLSPVEDVIARVRVKRPRLQSYDARVHRSSACLHMSCTHVYRDISVVH